MEIQGLPALGKFWHFIDLVQSEKKKEDEE
jgi:hypothetical protein